jgi:hypothetical protein
MFEKFTIDTLKASVRPYVTFLLTSAFAYGFLAGMINAETFNGVFGIIIGFWFNERTKGA